jgi:hypothetical protein
MALVTWQLRQAHCLSKLSECFSSTCRVFVPFPFCRGGSASAVLTVTARHVVDSALHVVWSGTSLRAHAGSYREAAKLYTISRVRLVAVQAVPLFYATI